VAHQREPAEAAGIGDRTDIVGQRLNVDPGAIVQRCRAPVPALVERHGPALRTAMLHRRRPMVSPTGQRVHEQHGGRAVSSIVDAQRPGRPGNQADRHGEAAFRTRAQSGR
jgi:hypothetical protein